MSQQMNGSSNGKGDPFSLSKLIKLLKLTTSDNNAEALLAMRKANDELKKLNLDWEGLLKGKVTVIGDPFAEAQRPQVRPAAPPPKPTSTQAAAPTYQAYRSYSKPKPAPQPAPPRPAPPKDITITNNFGGSCVSCGTWVEPGMGKATKFVGASKFVVHHPNCKATLRKHQAPNLDQL